MDAYSGMCCWICLFRYLIARVRVAFVLVCACLRKINRKRMTEILVELECGACRLKCANSKQIQFDSTLALMRIHRGHLQRLYGRVLRNGEHNFSRQQQAQKATQSLLECISFSYSFVSFLNSHVCVCVNVSTNSVCFNESTSTVRAVYIHRNRNSTVINI